MVDVVQLNIPQPAKDQHWDNTDFEIPYTNSKDKRLDQQEFDLGSALRT